MHTPAADIPALVVGDAAVRVLTGQAFGKTSPTNLFAPSVYLDVQLTAGGVFELPPQVEELAVYSIDSHIGIDGFALTAHRLAVLASSITIRTTASSSSSARLMVLGGGARDGHRLTIDLA